ncbi:MAG: ribosome-associated translation inhibitor RaiA [Acidobacteria bacterium]|nr:ribosome-associated translation inhibitor RaiA [Acidobacteriota bacterium]
MRIEIRSVGFTTTEALRAHVLRRLGSALARRADRIRRVIVRMSDENGPRGGLDKSCRIEAVLAGHPTRVSEGLAADLYTAIDAAARRLGRLLDRGQRPYL